MKIHFSEEWLRKKLMDDGEEPGGLMACSPEIYAQIIEANKNSLNPYIFVPAFHDEMKTIHEKVRERLIGKKYKITIEHTERNADGVQYSLKNTIHTIRDVSWTSHNGFAVVGEDHRVYINIVNIEFIDE
jgi:hypothetical protein